MSSIDGPRLQPAYGGPPRQLVIFAHGYGSNGQDLIGLAPYLARALPQALFVSPDAPDPVPGYPAGRQWFPISRIDPHLMAQGVRSAASAFDGFIDAELARAGLPASACALVGFSQGTMLALHVGLRRPEPLAAVIGLSGMLAEPGGITSRPPVALIHGDRDEVIPPATLFASLQGLGAAGVPVLWRMCAGTGHSVSEDGLALAVTFVQAVFAGRLAGWVGPEPHRAAPGARAS